MMVIRVEPTIVVSRIGLGEVLIMKQPYQHWGKRMVTATGQHTGDQHTDIYISEDSSKTWFVRSCHISDAASCSYT